jgi:hypothetical protein
MEYQGTESPTQDTLGTEVEVEDTHVSQDAEVETKADAAEETKPNKSIVDRIGDMISKAKSAVVGNSDDDGDHDDDIPDDFTSAMQAAGYDDESIIAFAATGNNGKPYSNKELLEMIPSLVKADSAEADDPAEKTKDAAPDGDAVQNDEEEDEDSQEDEKLKQLHDRIAELEKAQGIRDERSKQEELESFAGKASDLFDKASEEFEVFGKTDSLPTFPNGQLIPTSPQMKARNEVWNLANSLKEAGMGDDEALSVSLNAYKGRHLATQTKRNVIKDLKKNERRLGGKRISHEIANNSGKKLSGPDLIQEVARRHGHEIPD